MPITMNNAEDLIQESVESIFHRRYSGQKMSFERAADLTELKIELIARVAYVIKREMDLLPGQMRPDHPSPSDDGSMFYDDQDGPDIAYDAMKDGHS